MYIPLIHELKTKRKDVNYANRTKTIKHRGTTTKP